jgi:hypothetical protein
VKSKLASQLAEAAQQARDLNSEAAKFSTLKGAFAADLAAGIPQGTDVGGVAPTGGAGSPGAGDGIALAAGSVSEFLARLAADQGASIGIGGGGGSGGDLQAAPASREESLQAEALGESVEYLRDLMAAAAWARLSPPAVLRAPKSERDALIAAWEEATQTGSESTQGALSRPTGSPIYTDSLGNYNPLAAARRPNAPILAPLTPLTPFGEAIRPETAALKSGPTPDPTPAITSGAQATVGALGTVVSELRRLNNNVERKSTGIEYRTGGLS